jgi:Flp pilus assembly protein CpaB
VTNSRFSVITFVVCGLSFTSVALIKYGAHQLRGQPAQAPATATVLVAKNDVPAYINLDHSDRFFEELQVPPLWMPTISSAVRTFEEVNGKQLRKRLPAGAIIYKDDLREWESREQLEAKLESGERPCLFYVNREDFAEGTIWPGCRVDLVFDHEGRRRVLCRNRLLLEIDQRPPRDLPPQFDDCWLATTGLTGEQRVRVSLASQLGILRLIPATPED